MEQTQEGKKNFCLYDAGGSLEKNWFVYFYEGKKRIRKYGKINRETTEEGRRAAARLLMQEVEMTYQPPPANEAQREELYAALERLRPNIRKKTFQTYRWKLNHLFEALDGRAITAASLRWYFDDYLNGCHPTTAHDRRRQLQRLFTFAKLGHLLDGIKVRKVEPKPLRYFQPHQARRLMDEMQKRDPELRLWCLFVYFCFLRPRSELRLMKVEDIFFEERKILVRGEISKNRKTSYVAIPDAFLPELLPLQEQSPGSYIFPGKKNRPLGYNTMGRRHRLLLQEFGFSSDFAVYSWKHTGAVYAVRAGIGLKELQLQLRHHSLDQVNAYLRQLNVTDFSNLRSDFPGI